MSSLLFYFIGAALFLGAIAFMFYYWCCQTRDLQVKKDISQVSFNPTHFTAVDRLKEDTPLVAETPTVIVNAQSPYNSRLVVLQMSATPGKPYMGYELHQALLAAGLCFGEKNIFHCHEHGSKGRVLFSLAAATPSGEFNIENMGAFKCYGLLLFMYLDAKQKLMANFDLMIDTARQLTEELGGEIYDDLHQPIGVDVIGRLRKKICSVETSNLYAADLLDNLD